MGKKYFDNVKEIIENYSIGKVRPLEDCKQTIDLYFNHEKAANNEYRKLANRFRLFNDILSEKEDDSLGCSDRCYCEDKLFYLHLREKCQHDDQHYTFPLKNGKTVTAEVDVFHPFVKLADGREIIHPQWHLMISYYAYIDAAFNYPENKRMLELTGWTDNKRVQRVIKNNVLAMWMKEARI